VLQVLLIKYLPFSTLEVFIGAQLANKLQNTAPSTYLSALLNVQLIANPSHRVYNNSLYYLGQGCTSFPRILEPFQNSRR